MEEKQPIDRLMNWILSLIKGNDAINRIEYLPIYELITECLETGKSHITSNLNFHGNHYEIKIILTDRNNKNNRKPYEINYNSYGKNKKEEK